mmetsp:Transcript_2874/g.7820  ORF Transcript_2874/g.7820 Transcript_2874/m.7820 type:complete len:235 (+) Transcript_2874:921-1625(+)
MQRGRKGSCTACIVDHVLTCKDRCQSTHLCKQWVESLGLVDRHHVVGILPKQKTDRNRRVNFRHNVKQGRRPVRNNVGQNSQSTAATIGDPEDRLYRCQRRMQASGVRINNGVEEHEKQEERDASCIKQGFLAQQIRHFGIQSNECRGSWENPVNLEKGNSFGTTLCHHQCIFRISCEGQGHDDKEFDCTNQEKLLDLLVSVDREHRSASVSPRKRLFRRRRRRFAITVAGRCC